MNKKMKKYAIAFAVFLLVVVLIVVIAFKLEGKYLNGGGIAAGGKTASEYLVEKNTVYISGEAYLPRDGISTFLLIGVDSDGPVKKSESYNRADRSDFLCLFVINDKDKSFTLIHLNRDTMTDIDVLDMDGQPTKGTANAQIALAHAYGDGLEVSCENTVRAVEHLMYFDNSPINRSIDNYASITMGAISIINDYIGGVTVNLEEDYTELDPTYVKGATVTFKGDEALSFIRARSTMNDPTNIARMERQKLYLDSLISNIRDSGMDEEKLIELYKTISPYMVTNSDEKGVSDIGAILSDYTCNGIVSPEGESKVNEFAEFYVDEAALREFVVNMLFKKISD